MIIDDSVLKYEEMAVFRLRTLYARYGYRQYTMNKFEQYDFYLRNKDFLVSDNIITFTDTNGKLMALKPDVTLSIVKNTRDLGPDDTAKLYYDENVYRVSKGNHAFSEITQAGLECLGNICEAEIAEVMMLAARSLETISENFVLDISHLGIITALIESLGLSNEDTRAIIKAMGEKNPHEIANILNAAGAGDTVEADLLKMLVSVYGRPADVLPKLRSMLDNCGSGDRNVGAAGIAGPVTGESAGRVAYTECSSGNGFGECVSAAIDELENYLRVFDGTGLEDRIRIDFSVVDDINYYNGIVFKGFIESVPDYVLSGGEYDKLMRKMKRSGRAIGFAVYLDQLERLS